MGLLLGYLAGLWKFVDNQNVRTLITFVMSVALPCSLFGTIGQLSRAAVEQQGEVVAVFGITYVAVFLVVYFWAARWERFSPAQSAVLALTLSHPNVAAVGYPLLHGPASGVAVAAGLTIGSITVVPVTLAVLENNTGNRNPNLRAGGRSVVHSIVNALKKPVVWAIRMDPYQRDYVVLLSAIPCGFFGVVFGKDFPNAVSHYEIATLFRMPSSNSVDQTIRRTKTYDGQTLKVLKHQISHK